MQIPAFNFALNNVPQLKSGQGIGKIVQNGQTEPVGGTRRRMWIRREVKFVRSKGHKFRNLLANFYQKRGKKYCHTFGIKQNKNKFCPLRSGQF